MRSSAMAAQSARRRDAARVQALVRAIEDVGTVRAMPVVADLEWYEVLAPSRPRRRARRADRDRARARRAGRRVPHPSPAGHRRGLVRGDLRRCLRPVPPAGVRDQRHHRRHPHRLLRGGRRRLPRRRGDPQVGRVGERHHHRGVDLDGGVDRSGRRYSGSGAAPSRPTSSRSSPSPGSTVQPLAAHAGAVRHDP